MNKLFFPSIFHATDDNGFWVSFPDLPECLTQGASMSEAYEMAVDALGLCISYMKDNGESIPVASVPQDIVLNKGDFLVVIEFDMMDYLRKHNSKAVKKTLSIPEWLNEAATAAGINFSQVLREALIQKVQNL